jgi:hypothetical protein
VFAQKKYGGFSPLRENGWESETIDRITFIFARCAAVLGCAAEKLSPFGFDPGAGTSYADAPLSLQAQYQ